MKTLVYSPKPYDKDALIAANAEFGHDLHFLDDIPLNPETANLADGYEAVSVFVNDNVNAEVVATLARGGTKLIATRTAGFNHIDSAAAAEHGITVVRVPAYSPNSVSEFTVGLILTLGRSIHRAFNRTREGDFSLDRLVGFEIRDKTVGVIGTGRIGTELVKNLSGFGPRILAQDLYPSDEVKQYATYVDLDDLLRESDIICLMVPLTPETKHIINAESIAQMKDGVFLVNTSRGALVDTQAVIDALMSGKIHLFALDVYEEEANLFYKDLSATLIPDDTFARLMTLPNVLITGHQAYLTDHALRNIAETTLGNLSEFERTGVCENQVKPN
jgi:D-lactate dehydrogenase